MINFIWLIFAHCLGDWAWQPEWMTTAKSKHVFVMFAHCMIWAACICIALSLLFIPIPMWKILFLIIGHGIADWYKGKYMKHESDYWMVYLDQLWHILQLMVVYMF